MRGGRGGDGDGGVIGSSKGKLTLERVRGIKKQQIGGDESAAAELRNCEVHRYTRQVNGRGGGSSSSGGTFERVCGRGSSKWSAAPAGERNTRSAQKRTTPESTRTEGR